MNRSRARVLVFLVSALAAVGLIAPATASAGPYCDITWGSKARSVNAAEPGDDLVSDVRAGRHACYDRVVIDVAEVSGFDAWSVRYVPAVRQAGSGEVVPLRGGAALQVTLGAAAYDEDGDPTYSPANPREVVDVRGYTTLRQVRWLDSFEGQTNVGIGTRARLPFRAFVIEGSSAGVDRLVIDVAHRWQQ
ncbi:hypothetical protein ACI79C_20100 [Geodermatophilus sp. SYSU D00697]